MGGYTLYSWTCELSFEVHQEGLWLPLRLCHHFHFPHLQRFCVYPWSQRCPFLYVVISFTNKRQLWDVNSAQHGSAYVKDCDGSVVHKLSKESGARWQDKSTKILKTKSTLPHNPTSNNLKCHFNGHFFGAILFPREHTLSRHLNSGNGTIQGACERTITVSSMLGFLHWNYWVDVSKYVY